MNKIVDGVLRMIDKGKDIITISNLFGGLDNFFKLVSQYPTLEKIIKQKLSGDFLYRPEEDYENWREYRGEYIDIPINVISINDSSDDTEFTHLEIGINIQLPRFTNEEDLIKVANFINDHLTYGYGDDAILIDERNFISNKNWMGLFYVSSVNGISFNNMSLDYEVSEEEFVNLVYDKI